jgi:hypothetical protein
MNKNEQRQKILDDTVTRILEKLADTIARIISDYLDHIVIKTRRLYTPANSNA